MRLSSLLLVAAASVACFSGAAFASEDAAADTPVINISGGEAVPAATPSPSVAPTVAPLSGEKYEYQAEITRLMDIIINSLYQKKEIFLRELISNASDALDKIRFLALGDDKQLGPEGSPQRNLEIRVSFDKEAKTITLRDSGVGMTKAELISNLGTIARSGTAAFAEQLATGEAASLIGQFGVGFYSAYLAADRVRVATKSNNDAQQWLWESNADGTFTIAEDTEGQALGRGTAITLFLKEDSLEYCSEETLKKLIKRYSEFITFPIYLQTVKTEEVEVPVTEEAAATPTPDAEAKKEDGEDEEVVATEEETKKSDEPAKPKTKKETRTTTNWELVNDQKAIWQRKPSEVTDAEYSSFYKAISASSSKNNQQAADFSDPLTWMHFSAEGEVEFRSILFVPSTAPHDLYDQYYSKSSSLKLYVRRVLISDEFEDLMPRYLSFIKGVVDSDDLPLNVSREQLQQSKILKVMGKKLVRKALEMIRKLAGDQKKALADKEKEEKEGKKDEESATEEDKEAKAALEKKKKDAETGYDRFWSNFGKNIKLGVIEDSNNRSKLAKLLRFKSSKSGGDKDSGKWRSLDDYVADMKKDQKLIYYIAGESYDAVSTSPFLERLQQKDLEVLFLTDPIDEYCVQNLPEFDGHRLQSITKEGLQLPGDDGSTAKKREEAYKESFKPLADWLKKVLGDSKVEKVTISNRLNTSPVVLVTSQYGYSANLERIMKAQAFADPSKAQFMLSKKTMEINPRHPLIAALKDKAIADPEGNDADAKDTALLLYDAALLNSGFAIDDPKEFSARLFRSMKTGLSLDNLDLLPEIEVAADESEESSSSSSSGEEGEDAEAAAAEEEEAAAAADEGEKEEL